MMLFTPDYNIFYHGELHQSKKPFEIDDADAEEMRLHGIVHHPEKPAKRPGRPKKTDE